jgi:hypothetical protein
MPTHPLRCRLRSTRQMYPRAEAERRRVNVHGWSVRCPLGATSATSPLGLMGITCRISLQATLRAGTGFPLNGD